jgi:hypothetical protein
MRVAGLEATGRDAVVLARVVPKPRIDADLARLRTGCDVTLALVPLELSRPLPIAPFAGTSAREYRD